MCIHWKAMVMLRRSVHLTTLFSWVSLTKQLTSTFVWHILSLVTDNNPSWISGRRMTVETISWPISRKVSDQAGVKLPTPGSAVGLTTDWTSGPSTVHFVFKGVTGQNFNMLKTKSNFTLWTSEYIFTVFYFNQIRYWNEWLVPTLT